MEDVPLQFVFVLQANLAIFFLIYILHISVLLFLNVVINHTLVLTSSYFF